MTHLEEANPGTPVRQDLLSNCDAETGHDNSWQSRLVHSEHKSLFIIRYIVSEICKKGQHVVGRLVETLTTAHAVMVFSEQVSSIRYKDYPTLYNG